jgi:hypothetical protein
MDGTGSNDISFLPFVLLQAEYSYYRVPMSQAFLFQKAGDQDNHTLIVCGVVPCYKRRSMCAGKCEGHGVDP